MRDIDERVATVKRRAKTLRRRRERGVLGIVTALALFFVVDLAGRTYSGGSASPVSSDGGLFGASSLFGPSIGGYVLVALVVAAAAVLVTVLVMARRRSNDGGDAGLDGDEADGGRDVPRSDDGDERRS